MNAYWSTPEGKKTSLALHTTFSLCVIEQDAATDNTKISTGPCMCDSGKQILLSVSVLNYGTDLIGTGGREGEIPFGGWSLYCLHREPEREKNEDEEGERDREREKGGQILNPTLIFVFLFLATTIPCFSPRSSRWHAAAVGRGLQSMMHRPS